jgi:restriction system protein
VAGAPMTIVEAIKTVLKASQRPMTAGEVYEAIVAQDLYRFLARNPLHVTLTQLRKHSVGVERQSASPTKHFALTGVNRYVLLPKTVRIKGPGDLKRAGAVVAALPGVTQQSPLVFAEKELWAAHGRYLELLRKQIVEEIRRLEPTDFEVFARELLDAYGFEQTQVTSVSGDGGIDGHGKLRVGLAYLGVAFQCKRWTRGNVQRPEIDKFRGAAQGEYEQGIFFTTSSFSKGALAASLKRCAIPIVLIDAKEIVRLMIEKRFRVESSVMEIPSLAL